MAGLMLIILVAFVIYEIWYAKKWKGVWRLVMLLPLFLVAGVILNIAIDPESHNLFPFEVIIWVFIALLFKLILIVMRKIIRKEKSYPVKDEI